MIGLDRGSDTGVIALNGLERIAIADRYLVGLIGFDRYRGRGLLGMEC